MGGEHLTSKACGQERLATSERMNWVSLKLRRLPGVRTTHLCFDSDPVAKQAKCSRAVRRFCFGQQVLLQRGNVAATMALVGLCWQIGCGRDELGLPTTPATLFGGVSLVKCE